MSRSNENTATLFELECATKTNSPTGSIAKAFRGSVPPVENGEPDTGVRAPVSGSLRCTQTRLRAESVEKNKTAHWINNYPCRAAAGIDAPLEADDGSCRSPLR